MNDEDRCQELYKQFWLDCLDLICGTLYDYDGETVVDEEGDSSEVVGVSASEAKEFTATVVNLAAKTVLKIQSLAKHSVSKDN